MNSDKQNAERSKNQNMLFKGSEYCSINWSSITQQHDCYTEVTDSNSTFVMREKRNQL